MPNEVGRVPISLGWAIAIDFADFNRREKEALWNKLAKLPNFSWQNRDAHAR